MQQEIFVSLKLLVALVIKVLNLNALIFMVIMEQLNVGVVQQLNKQHALIRLRNAQIMLLQLLISNAIILLKDKMGQSFLYV